MTRRRITVQLDEDLYTRLRTFAKGRSHGFPFELSSIVREALEHYITPSACQTSAGERGNKMPDEPGNKMSDTVAGARRRS